VKGALIFAGFSVLTTWATFGIFAGHGQVPTKGLLATQRFALGAIFVYQLALLYRFEHDQELCVGLKAFLKAA
jgi:hypothetical protein